MSSSFQGGKRRKTANKTKQRRTRKRQVIQAEPLEVRQLLAADVFVDDDWAGVAFGADPDGAGPAMQFGIDSFATIQEGVNAVDADGTVTVGDGTYVENVTIAKNLTLQSENGRGLTTIEGIAGNGELGTLFVKSPTTAVTIDGFTIIGFDSASAGIENAAVYFQGNHSGAKILNNDIVANGEAGLLTEYGATIDNFVIDGNIFSGQTFVGPNPAGNGFGTQFTELNVPRQLVAMGGGTGGGNTSNVTFTNNDITGTAGGLNPAMEEQGNTLVTIDSKGATITGNTFEGTTTRYGSSLRSRGDNTTIENNTFDLSNQSATTNAMFLQGSGKLSTDPDTLGDVLAKNTFTEPVFAYGNQVVPVTSIQSIIDLSTAGDVLLFSGEFTENVDVNKAVTLGGEFKLNGTLDLSAAGAILSAGYSPGIIASGDLTLTGGSSLAVEFNGLGTAGVDYDQYQVAGTVDLGGATFSLTGAAAGLAINDEITIIDNDGVDAVTGTFAGLANGAVVSLNSEDYRIFYNGGDGNDVVLVRDTLASAAVLVDDDFAGVAANTEVATGFFYLVNAFSTIQEGVADVDAGGTVTVNDGMYAGNVTINKNLTLQSTNGRSVTTIDGNNGGSELGTIFVTSMTTDVTIDGFTILGLDGTPGLEKAAIYFQGSHSGAKILNNDVVARGDEGLITEYGATIDNFLIDGNIFSGQTFVGANPAGNGFSQQFSLANVPRQLVVMGGGSGGGNTSNITFTNNDITGTAGGFNTSMEEQGNTLVTIDSKGAVITGNTFAGTTTRYGSSLRARGENVTLENNTFDLTNQTPTTSALFLTGPGGLSTAPDTFEDIFAKNDFGDNAYFVNGSIGVGTMQEAIDVNAAGSVIYFIGSYTDPAVDINKALTVAGEFDLTGTLTASVTGATISAGFSPGIITTGDLTLTSGSVLAVEFNALGTASVDYDQYQVTGAVDLGGATFSLTGLAAGLSLNDEITIIDNDGVDAVTGTFAGLANGAVVSLNAEDYRIFYTGGDGNDVVLVRDTLASPTVLVDDDFAGAAANAEVAPGFFYLINAFATIQEGVDDVTAGGTVTVNDGAYVENVSLYKELTLVSTNGRDATNIEGISGVGALATIVITSDNVTLGQSGNGFTIIGIDNGSPGIENAAIYLDNANDGTTIEGNRILANGDSAILTEYNMAVSNLIINDNIIGGATFVDPPNSGNQFTTPNVPRGLVYINGGSTNDNTGQTANITFTNNTIEGKSGGIDGAMTEVGQSLVTIDSDGAIITGNEFKGTTFGTAAALTARGKGAVVAGNTFDTTTQGDFTNIVSLLNTSTGELSISPATLFDLLSNNTFVDSMAATKAYFVFIPGSTPSRDRMVVRTLEQNDGTLQGAVDAAEDGSILYFLDLYGAYAEDLDVNKPVTVGGEFTLSGELKASVAGATINAGFSPGTIASTDLTLTAGSTLTVEIDDVNAAGTDFDQYVVTGTVDLGGATLDVVVTPPVTSTTTGFEMVLIDNDGSDAVVGTFAGINNGDVISIDGEDYLLFYNGGDGNDVVLIRDSDMTPIVYVDDDWATGVAAGDEVLPGYYYLINAFATIQEGVADVDTDGQVRVLEGSYDGTVLITRGVSVLGQGAAPGDVYLLATAGSGFEVNTAGDVTLENMQVQSSLGTAFGVQVDNGGNIALEDLVLNNSAGGGFFVANSITLAITDVEYAGNGGKSVISAVDSFIYHTTTGEDDLIDINSPSIGGQGFFQHNRGGVDQDVIQYDVVNLMYVSTFDGLDRFTVAPHLTTQIFLDGGNPVVGDANVPPGDVLALYLNGVNNPVVGSTPTGTVTSSNYAPILYTNIETIIRPDSLETNDSIAQATILGSPESVILNNLSIDDDTDVDFFRYTAHFTGKLYVNALFTNLPQGDLQLDIFDQSGDLIASVNTNDDNEQLIIPVVSQQKYFIRVSGVVDDVNQYSLEIENFEAPAPHGILISPLTDSGSSSLDNVTNSSTPLIYIQDDILQFVDENGNNIAEPGLGELSILTAAQATAGMTPGYAVQISITNLNTGVVTRRFADSVGPVDQATVFLYDPNVYGDTLVDGNYLISARTVVFDGQTPIAQGNASLSTSVRLTVDAVTPGGSMPTMVTTSDSGTLADDEVTNISQPIFKGTGEANTKVYLYANNNTNPIGQGTVDSQGNWSVQVSPLADGVYSIRAAYEDLAGNRSAPSPGLQIEIDTLAPNTPYLDLITASDSGQVNDDNVTNDNTPTFTMTTTDPNSASHIFSTNFQFRIYARPEGGAEFLLYDSSTDGAIPAANVADGLIDLSLLTRETGALADGRYNFKLEVEDRAGNISTDYLLGVTIDTVAPTGVAPDLLASSDSGMLDNDWVTNIDTPTFSGTGEVNSKVFLYAGAELVGQTVVNADGSWTIKSTALEDGVYEISTIYEDLAGNRSTPQIAATQLEVDTYVPNTPYLDLAAESDTGRNDEDNVTRDNTLTFNMTTTDPNQASHLFNENYKFRIYLRAENGSETLLYDSSTEFTSIDPLLDGYTELEYLSRTMSTLADGYHDFKLEVEDRAGNISTDYLLDVVIDTAAPDAPTLELDPSTTDTGVTGDPNTLADHITSDSNTGFVGDAESNSVIRLYANDTPLDAATLATLTGMAPADVISFLNANYVYQGLTAATPLDGNDGNPEVGSWGLTGKYDLNNPNYFAYDGIRQIVVTSEDLAGNISIVSTLELMIDTQGPTIENVSVTGSPDYDLFAPKPSVDGPTPPITSLDIDFSDLPVRPGVQIFAPGNSPDVTFIIDASASTLGGIAGTQVGDLNGDGIFNTILDAEIAAIIQANQQLIDAGLGDVARVSLVVMVSGTAVSLDLNVNSKFTTAAADNNNDGKLDLINALESINAGGSANFTAGLEEATTLLANSGFANSTVLFLADGFSGTPGAHAAAAADLQAVAENIYAVGVGSSDLAELQIIDPNAEIFGTTNALLNTSVVAPVTVDDYGFVYSAIAESTALQPGTFQLIGDANGLIPIKSITITNDTSPGSIGRSTVTLEFFEALPDDRYTLKIADSLTDPAGNSLDGESNAAEPQDDPSFATGNGVPGGSFLARFTIDTHPEIGVSSYGTTLIDINGNWMIDTENGDDTNEDLTFMFGFSTDDVFAGQFTPAAGSVADGFDRLAVYGKVNGKFRFQFDFDNDGAPDATVVQNLQINGLPVAGNFDGNAANGDEVGVYVGETGVFWIDTNHDNQIDTPIYTSLVGKPIVGDWDGDGFDDLGVWRDDQFFLDLTNGVQNGWDGTVDQSFYFGFEGVRERPVSADFNSDGVEDLGLWVPDQQNLSSGQAEWFILISDSDANGVARPIWENPARMILPSEDPLGRTVARFLTDPFGPDQYAVFGNSIGLPIAGNFDPPVADSPSQNPTPVIEFPEINVPSAPWHGSTWEEAADLDHDGAVTLLDVALVVRKIGSTVSLPSEIAWAFDIDHDGTVTLFDLSQVIRKIGASQSSSFGSFSLEAESVAMSSTETAAASAPVVATYEFLAQPTTVSSISSDTIISDSATLEGEKVSDSPLIWTPGDVGSTSTATKSASYEAVDADVVSATQDVLEGELVDEQLLDSLAGDNEHVGAVDRFFTEEEDELDDLFVF